MENKRYSIVRVDNSCPEYMEDFKCHFPDISIECMSCHHHRYGDTKEQLIRKVATAIRKSQVSMFYNNSKGWVVDKLAKEIVEFLGVVE